MPLNPLTLSVSAGVQNRPFQATIGGLTVGSIVEIGNDGSPGFAVVNGRLMSTGLPYPVSTAVIRERISTGEARETRLDITAATGASLLAQAVASLAPGRVLVRTRVAGERQADGSIVYTLRVEDDLGATVSLPAGLPPTPAGPLKIATGGSSTLERAFSEFTGYTDNARVTVSTNGTTFAQLGGVGAGAHTLGDILVANLNRDVQFLKSGVRGTTLAQWEADASTQRAALVSGINAMGGVDMLLMQVGFNDATNTSTITIASHAALLRSLLAKIRAEVGAPSLKILLGGSQKNNTGNTTNEGKQAGIIRQAEMLVVGDANNFMGCATYDLAQAADGIHQTEAAYVSGSGPRWGQAITSLLQNGSVKRGPGAVSATPVSTTQTDVTIQHRSGSDFTPTSGITGAVITKDAGTTYTAITGARISPTVIRFTHADSGGAAQQILIAAQGAPDTSAPLLDNTAPVALPIEPTSSPVNVAAVGAALAISGTPGTATQNQTYSYTPATSGGTAPYSFARTGTALLAGLSFSATTGAISGTPTATGTTSGIIITATDAVGANASQTIAITVAAASAAIVMDSFTDTNGVLLSAHTANIGGAWTVPAGGYDIQTNRIRPTVAGSNAFNAAAMPADGYVEWDYTFLSITAQAAFNVLRAADDTNFYQGGYRPSTGNLSLGKTVNGTFTEFALTAVPFSPAAGSTHRFRLETQGTTLRLLVNGTVMLTTTDTSFAAGGRAGIRSSGAVASTTTGLHFDNVTAGAL